METDILNAAIVGKITIATISLIILLGLTCSRGIITVQATGNFDVLKIDSINNYYLIYAGRNDSIFKVVSNKPLVNEKKCNEIKVGSSYAFVLHSSLSWTGEAKYFSPKYNPQIGCVAYDDSTSICVESGMVRDLFYADNIKGLCFIGR